MTTFQKVIKYLALSLAIFICVAIITSLVGGVKLLLDSFDFIKEKDTEYNELINYDDSFEQLDISLKGSNLIIKQDNKFSVESNDKNIKIYSENGKLRIADKNKRIVNKNIKDLIITIPANTTFEEVNIETGVGTVNVDGLYVNILGISFGAGKAILKNINSNKSLIETGTGNVKITDSTLNDMNLEMGIGKMDIDAKITGNSSIESGIGSLNLNLKMPISEYGLTIEKGIGSIRLNGKEISNRTIIGTGDNFIKVEGGIGSIYINTLEE